MATWFVTRHAGAVEWARRQGVRVDIVVKQLDPRMPSPGDRVVGTLPVHLAAAVCQRGIPYVHLALDLPPRLRGRELTADDMQAAAARLEPYYLAPMDRAGVDGGIEYDDDGIG